MTHFIRSASFALVLAGASWAALVAVTPAYAQYRQEIANDPGVCRGEGPSIRVNISDVQSADGAVRIQLYRGIEEDWLESGRWIYRMEAPARQGSMSFCLPVPRPGTYAVAVRHDINGNGETDIFRDGGAMSNNPSINIFNLGKPSYRKTRFEVGNAPVTINIRMRYM